MLNVKAMKIKLLLLAILCFTLSGVQAQQYLEMIEDGSYRVEEIVASAEAYLPIRTRVEAAATNNLNVGSTWPIAFRTSKAS